MENKKAMTILNMVCIIPLIIGILLMSAAKSKIEYSTDEYWVAADYHHVYEKTTGEIVDYISENEDCDIKGDTITVTTYKKVLYDVGVIMSILFGMFTAVLVIGYIQDSEWWDRLCHGR